MGYEEAVSEMTQAISEQFEQIDDAEDFDPRVYQHLIATCEQHDVDDKVDAIIEAHRQHFNQQIEQTLQELEYSLRQFSGL